MKKKIILLFLVCIALRATSLSAQSDRTDYDAYYHSPVAVSAFYQPLSGMGSTTLSDFVISEVSGEVRFSFRKAPRWQPLVRGGMVDYAFVGDLEDYLQDWSHRHIFGGAGMGYSLRISREFEVGGDIFCGITQSIFSELQIPGITEPQGQLNLIGKASARLALNPSYNISIGVTPSIQYVHGLGPLNTFDGFTFGVGFGGSYRFGQDPDAPQSSIRALRFAGTDFPPLFAAMQSYYAVKAAGTVAVTNSASFPVTRVTFSFMQPGFMDSATPLGEFENLQPEETLEIPVRAVFNNQIFTTQGVTPLTGELIVQYTARGRQVEQRQSITYDLYDRNALTWNDDRKAAAFVTPQDSAIRNFASYIRQSHHEATNQFISKNLQFAMQAYNALSEIGIIYQVDPTSPFTEVQEDAVVVDSISFPRETLLRRTGDCDDLTVLYNTLLQTVGIPTAFVTTPGHIFCAFSTGLSAQDAELIDPDRSMTLEVNGELWALVEITMLGRSPFLDAWSTGISEFRAYDNNTRVRGFYPVSEAQETYRPVALRETDLGLQYGDGERMVTRFRGDMDRLSSMLLEPLALKAKENNRIRDWNKYGISAAKLGASRQAQEAFQKVIQMNEKQLSARLNLGSLYYLDGDYHRALQTFQGVENLVSDQPSTSGSTLFNLYINLGKSHYALNNIGEAGTYYGKAREISPESAGKYSYLGSGSSGSSGTAGSALASAEIQSAGDSTARASEAITEEPILFFSEDE
ncbi:MAG: hypothetical protein JW760_09860 [Spirochaetales bacterium]|nr:hypothetical protein [Spirochaetales bacterium]